MANARSNFSQDYVPQEGVPQEAVSGSVPLTDSQIEDVLMLLRRELRLPARISRMVGRKIEGLSHRIRSYEVEF